MSRRRALLMALIDQGTLATKWYTLNSSVSDSAGRNTKPYYFVVYINGKWFYYESDYPFYVVDNGSSYYIVFAYGHTLRNGSNYTTGNNFGTKNGIVYYEELYTRTSIIQSKQNIYIWRT